jgi:hypothetical protein
MSWFPAKDPEPGNSLSCDAIELVIVPRTADLGGFTVRRALPSTRRRMVGPFIFFDHMGPAEFRAGAGEAPKNLSECQSASRSGFWGTVGSHA